MLGRKKSRSAPDDAAGSGYAGPPGREESLRVLNAFLGSPSPGPAGGQTAPPPPLVSTPPFGSPSHPPPPPPLAAPQTVAARPGEAPFVFNITPLVGAEKPYANSGVGPAAAGTIPIPGLGTVSAIQVTQAYERINQLVTRLSGGVDLSHRWTPAQVHTALEGLETMHAQGGVDQEQYLALRAALESMLAG